MRDPFDQKLYDLQAENIRLTKEITALRKALERIYSISNTQGSRPYWRRGLLNVIRDAALVVKITGRCSNHTVLCSGELSVRRHVWNMARRLTNESFISFPRT